MKESYTKKNLSFSIISLIVSISQTLWFIPFISQKMGTEAYGYIAVVMTILNLSTVISIAITSMSSRYIAIEMQKNDFDEANRYFNSILTAVCCVALLLLSIFILLTVNLNKIMVISNGYLSDVKVLMLISGISLIFSVLNTPFLAGLFYTNKLYVMYSFSIINYLSKMIVPIILFKLDFIPLWGMSIGGLLVDLVSFIFYLTHYKVYLPNIQINFLLSEKSYILRVLNSGIWISITKTGNLLNSNLGTYLSNILLGAYLSGIYATILQLQTLITVMVTAIVSIFVPKMIKLHANENKDNLIQYIKDSIRYLSFPLGIISGGIIIFGPTFMTLWIGQTYSQYWMLIILMIVGLPLSLPAEILNQANITINKVKIPAITTLIFGFINIILIYIFCFRMEFGVIGIALSQLITSVSRGFFFFTLYTSYQIGNSIYLFILDVLFCPFITLITTIISLIISQLFYPSTMLGLIMEAGFTTVIVISISYWFIFNKKEKEYIKNILK